MKADEFWAHGLDDFGVGGWLHVEQMDTRKWWLRIGPYHVWVRVRRGGNKADVTIGGVRPYAVGLEAEEPDHIWESTHD